MRESYCIAPTLCLITGDGRDLTPLIVTLSMIGKFAMTGAFATVVLYAQELYPTNVRFVLVWLIS